MTTGQRVSIVNTLGHQGRHSSCADNYASAVQERRLAACPQNLVPINGAGSQPRLTDVYVEDPLVATTPVADV